MFGHSARPIAFEPYGRRRTRARIPRWLLLLLAGTALGVTAVIVVQERYLPPRLSASASTELRNAFDTADAARLRLEEELGRTSKQLEAALLDKKKLTSEIVTSRASVDTLRADLSAVIDSLPPDPRAGAVEIRSGRFVAKAGALHYDLALTRDASARPLVGAVHLVITGDPKPGGAPTVSAEPVPLSIETQRVLRGSVSLPEGFKPRQARVQVVDRSGDKSLGMRVLLVR